MFQKFDEIKLKFWGFVQQVKLFSCVHPSRYSDGILEVGFVGILLSDTALSWSIIRFGCIYKNIFNWLKISNKCEHCECMVCVVLASNDIFFIQSWIHYHEK